MRGICNRAFTLEFTDHHWMLAQGGWHVLATLEGEPVGHASVVPRIFEINRAQFRTGYVEAVATVPEYQGIGIGRCIMEQVAVHIESSYELGALSTGLHDFYRPLGWEAWGGPTYQRRSDGDVRTPDRDPGLMVRRFGRSQSVALGSSICLGPRPSGF
jgi:GNAT superfamily N-acetyltransferase